MARKDPRVDAYIAKSAPFAQPILRRLRKLVHATEAKAEATRKRRLDTAVGWMGEGKPRNWKYTKRQTAGGARS